MRRLFSALHCVATVSMLAGLGAWSQAEAKTMPGPSIDLFRSPYYSCVNNYYVALTGSDSNNGTSASTPWQTLQHANNVGRHAGDCVNVAPGTYTKGVWINSGGNAATKTGYVVYRCEKMDACIVTDVYAGGQNGSFVWNSAVKPMTSNYVIIDGFTMKASKETGFGQGVELWDGGDTTASATKSVHHVWIINSIISGYGQSGIQMNDGEYFYVIHNTIYNNSRVGCSAQGSGVSFAALKAFSGYTRTPDDAKNKMVGNIGNFNNAVEWNVVYNNAMTQCGTAKNPYDTDGNNIIMDTLNNAGSTNVTYPGAVLIAFNITYNSGARGIHVFRSENVTIANNSCYNNALDPANQGTYRPCIGDALSYAVNVFNNISYAITGSGFLAYNNAFTGGNIGGGKPLDVFVNNISYCVGSPPYGCTPMYSGDKFSCTSNKCNTNPLWLSVGVKTEGTEVSQPISANFALQAGSPAAGKGLREPYLSEQSVDIGACAASFTFCPKPWMHP